MSEQQVLADLEKVKGNRARLMQQYSDEMNAILVANGWGSPSDVPPNAEHPYHKVQHKQHILHRLP